MDRSLDFVATANCAVYRAFAASAAAAGWCDYNKPCDIACDLIHTMKWLLAAFAVVSLNALAVEVTLEIVSDQQRLTFSQSQLLSRHDLKTIAINDSDYKKRLTQFKAIPILSLFKGIAIPDDAVVQFNSTDGFSATLEKTRLFSTDPKASTAFLAIEDPKKPWPPLPGKKASAGPFYLVWKNPEASSIGPEEWPYQIASFKILSDPRSVFPKIYPAADAAPNVQNGFKSFQKNCFACHKMNGNGAGSIGPDLNLPLNPTEYFEAKALESLIRDPASVRNWPRRTMSGFSKAAIPDAELSDLIAYLRYMSTRKEKVSR
jgi:mono/diheme cytochrome c family protein